MPSEYRTIFVPTHPAKKESVFKLVETVDGSQLARDVQAMIEEMEFKGYELKFMNPVNSSVPWKGSYRTGSSGMLMVFKRLFEDD
ncbi:MAG: hypothetical protein AAF502_05975 [Bacteroidota bacterium]